MEKKKKQKISVPQVIANVLANLVAILSANYIVFYILDHFNPGFRFVVHSDFLLTKYLHVVIPVLMLLTALLYLLLYFGRKLKRRSFSKKRLIAILAVDVLLAGAFAMTVNARAFGWIEWLRPAEETPVAIATMPPTPTPAPTEVPTPDPTPQETPKETAEAGSTASNAPTETPEPTEAPTPAPTTIPGLLGDKFKDKFSEGEPVVSEPNTEETLEDGTVRTLIYTYAGKSVAIEVYHCKKGRKEYQIAELYVRDIEKLTAAYENNQGKTKSLAVFADNCGALVAVSSDYFSANANGEGLIIRNGVRIRSNPCKHSDLCVLYQDGTVRCYDCVKEKIDNNEILANYPYHSFYFGPSLLDENGAAKTKFNSTLGGLNPRTVFGYYEPGHYAFISVLGNYDRCVYDFNTKKIKKVGKSESEGMTFVELSNLCASLGMKAAYNLDGGRSIGMYWNGKQFGHNMREIGDILAVID